MRCCIRRAVAVILLLFARSAEGYLGLSGTPGPLDFFLREAFRGDEVEDRDFRYRDDYFLNVFSTRHLTSSDALWGAAARGYRLAMGSVTSDEFFLDQEARFEVALLPGLALHYRFVQAEDYDSRYLRHAVGLSYRTTQALTAYGFTRLNGFKEDIDAGGGLRVTAGPLDLDLGFVFPQAFLNLKSRTEARFEKQAFGLGGVATLALAPRWHLTLRLFRTFPLELEKPREALLFSFRRLAYGASVAYHFHPTRSLRLALYGEDAVKVRQFSGSRAAESARLERTALRLTLVYTQAWPGGTLLDTGLFVHYFYEPTRFPQAPAQSLTRRRTEVIGFGQLAMPVWKGFTLVPGVFLGPVEAVDRRTDALGFGLEAKVSLALAYRFSPRAYLQLQPSYDLDDRIFGGAGPTLVVVF
ncbi:MAG: hypothetical protein KatS3mg131_3980 [Candidatus Tectimicrobiota bacterium]|nr:MAG: hypothetical protein KatS3mg131_3980 [Candidatus Tectomicrobia bacterium]